MCVCSCQTPRPEEHRDLGTLGQTLKGVAEVKTLLSEAAVLKRAALLHVQTRSTSAVPESRLCDPPCAAKND